MTRLSRLRAAAPWLLGLCALVFFGAASGHVLHDMRCALAVPDVDPPARRARLLRCSNIEQAVDAPRPPDAPADAPGWGVFAAGRDGGARKVFVTLRNYAGGVVFYPRVSGRDSSVVVNEPLGKFSKKLFSLSGRDGVWTPVGDQYALCLRCVENGWSDEEFPVTLEIVLTGPGAQLWHKGDIVFFEAP